MFIKKISQPLYRALGIFLPLITTNCAILGLALFIVLKEYSFIEGIFYGVGAGAGFTLAITIMAGIREELDIADVPKPFKGAPITLIIAGILALGIYGIFRNDFWISICSMIISIVISNPTLFVGEKSF